MKLNARALGLSLGILWGAFLVLCGLLAMAAPDYCGRFVGFLGTKYLGYGASLPGAVIGGIWGFCDAGICGLLIAWLYNRFAG